jgi:4'-phosphopantetheinyl transferase
MLEVIALNLNDSLGERKFERFIPYIPIEKRERIGRFHIYEDVLRTLIGDIFIRYLLYQRLKNINQKLIFGVNKYGKPYLKNYTGIEFNISHSGTWITCSIDSLPVGIDIEQIKTINLGIAERFFSKEEVKALMYKCIDNREAFFYELWTLKESYIKAIGKGLSIPLDSFTIQIEGEKISVYSLYITDNYYFKQYSIDKDYKMAVCSRKNAFPQKITFINVNEMCEDVWQQIINNDF